MKYFAESAACGSEKGNAGPSSRPDAAGSG